jgi:signal transduction histidine kinase
MSGQSLRMSTETASNLNQFLREGAALRRVAMLVAEEATQAAVFEAVAVEAGGLLASAQVQVARVDDPADVDDTIAQIARDAGTDCAIGVPIVVGGTPWGALVAVSATPEALPTGSAARLADFSQLVASAIASVQAHEKLRSLAESQGALRRVATLVAQGADPKTVFAAVAVEASMILGVGAVSLLSYDADNEMFTKIFGTHGQRSPVPDGTPWPVEDCPEGALVLATGRPARVDDWTNIPGPTAARHRELGFGQAVAAPIIVDGAIWGHIAAYGEADEILPAGSETRLADYTHLMASAISNAQARDELRGLAEQQGAALRRVAMLVAQQAPPGTIFNAVAGEASRALGVPRVDVGRCHSDGSVTLLGSTGGLDLSNDHAFSKSGEYVAVKVMETGRAARVDDWTTLPAPDAEAAIAEGFRSVVGAPIIVDGTLWGVIVVLADEILRDDTGTRLTDFTHLVVSSISNVHARNNLIASRARIVTASDETRRRIERNLHDGIQQRVVSLTLSLRAVQAGFPLPREVQMGLDEVARDLEGVLEEIRVFSHGLHPALLAQSGLGPSLRALARRSTIPVNLDVAGGPRLPEPIETAVYYVVSEALANAAKHSQASEVSVTVVSDVAGVRATVADDGVGGAALGRSSGLIGLVDRVEALGGRFALESPVGRGTTISIELPPDSQTLDERPTL